MLVLTQIVRVIMIRWYCETSIMAWNTSILLLALYYLATSFLELSLLLLVRVKLLLLAELLL
jgi:hypothetical protein